jgi:hypothetical protein
MVIVAAPKDIYVGRMVNELTGPTTELLQTHLVLNEMGDGRTSDRTVCVASSSTPGRGELRGVGSA